MLSLRHTLIALAATALTASADDFDRHFCDSTLRLDYIFAGDASRQGVYLASSSKSAGWAGRRTRLDRMPLSGNGSVTVTDPATGDMLYTTTFSSLFHEWLSTPEAPTTPKAMSNVFLVPLPKDSARITISLLDSRHRPMASMSHIYRPDDELVGRPDATPQPHRYIHRGGDTDKAIDVAILAEGYTAEQTDSFYTHAAQAVEAILAHEPFRSMPERFNFVAVASPSADEGVSVPRLSDWRSTAFSSHFSTFYSDRYLTTSALPAVHDALRGIPYEHIIILANTPEYGGGGIYNSYTLTAARHPLMRPVVVHEFGHSFGGLADEYFYEQDVMSDTYPLDVEPWEPNITTLVDFPSKWQALIPDSVPQPTPVADANRYPIGLYEGGGYSFKGVYRPADQCRMRTNAHPSFCPACTDAMRRLILFYTEP